MQNKTTHETKQKETKQPKEEDNKQREKEKQKKEHHLFRGPQGPAWRLDAEAQLVAGGLHLPQALQVVGPRAADQDLDVVLLKKKKSNQQAEGSPHSPHCVLLFGHLHPQQAEGSLFMFVLFFGQLQVVIRTRRFLSFFGHLQVMIHEKGNSSGVFCFAFWFSFRTLLGAFRCFLPLVPLKNHTKKVLLNRWLVVFGPPRKEHPKRCLAG